jgi:hypothetical protein
LCQDGIGRSCMALVFGTFLNFLKKRQDRHHLVMFTWSTFVENDATTRGKPHKGQQRAEPRSTIWEATTCTKLWTVILGNANANPMTREVCYWRSLLIGGMVMQEHLFCKYGKKIDLSNHGRISNDITCQIMLTTHVHI